MSKEKQELVQITGVQKYQQQLVSEIQTTMGAVGCDLTPYGTKCAMNAIAGAISFLNSKGKTLKNDVNATLFKLSVQNVAVMELNYASVPSEIYFDLRGDILTIKAQGAGNEKLVRKYGVGIVPQTGLHNPWLVREGDEFTLPSYNGLEITPPTWKPKSLSDKVIFVVYPVQKVDGSTEYLIADREGIKPSIVAQIRQNALYGFKNEKGYNDTKKRDEFYEQLNKDADKMTIEELIDCPKYDKFINPTYTSVGSKEAMIIRKMMNNALKRYPKEYDNAYIKDAVEGLNEDNDDSIKKKYVEPVDITKKVDNEVDAEVIDKDAPKDFKINEDGEIIKEETPKEAEVKETEKPQEQEQVEKDYGF